MSYFSFVQLSKSIEYNFYLINPILTNLLILILILSVISFGMFIKMRYYYFIVGFAF